MREIKAIFSVLSSLKLTVICLTCSLVIVFAGTIAQVDQGLYLAQERFFRSFMIYWTPQGASFRVPVFPGGYLVGAVLLVNLLAAHYTRFELSKKKIGIFMVHGGLILLLVGQLLTELFSTESHMRLTEGESRSYSENGRQSELVVVDPSDSAYDDVVSIPAGNLKDGREVRNPRLPVSIKVVAYHPNSRLSRRGPMVAKGPAPATQGVGQSLELTAAPITVKMDERNLPSAVVELVSSSGSLGTWLVSSMLEDLQDFQVNGKTYKIGMRFERYYKPFNLSLMQFTHEKYRGTQIPKNFASRVRVQSPGTGEDREVLIYMNNPLRYGGETFYQSGFDENDPRVTILQVVKNPTWLTPYLACTVAGTGLIVQFLSHLIGFAKRRKS